VEQVVVKMADCAVGNVPGQVLVTFALGSCIGLAAYDPVASVGGLLHYMLPDSSIDPERARANPYMFADTGIPLLLDRLYQRGASKRRLVLHAVGAARMLDPKGVFEIGKRNHLAVRKILWKIGILLQGEAVGGDESRTLRLEIGTGRLWFQQGGTLKELASPPPRKGGSPWPTAS
jgi:chemotaxis protein CheD